jgi:hypothetical protein
MWYDWLCYGIKQCSHNGNLAPLPPSTTETIAAGHENDVKYIEKIKACHDLPFYMSCESQKKNDDKHDEKKVIQKMTVIQSASSTAAANEADISNCKLDGSADGIQQKFDTAKYQACKLHTNNDKIYYDGFVTGCMNVGNTKLICETVADSNILNIKTQPTQTQTTEAQSTQAIQPTAVGES